MKLSLKAKIILTLIASFKDDRYWVPSLPEYYHPLLHETISIEINHPGDRSILKSLITKGLLELNPKKDLSYQWWCRATPSGKALAKSFEFEIKAIGDKQQKEALALQEELNKASKWNR